MPLAHFWAKIAGTLDAAAISPAALALIEKQDIEWFDAISEALKKAPNRPTVHSMTKLGTPLPRNPSDRGWEDIRPFDGKFRYVGINPGFPEEGSDAPLDGLSFAGGFSLKVGDSPPDSAATP